MCSVKKDFINLANTGCHVWCINSNDVTGFNAFLCCRLYMAAVSTRRYAFSFLIKNICTRGIFIIFNSVSLWQIGLFKIDIFIDNRRILLFRLRIWGSLVSAVHKSFKYAKSQNKNIFRRNGNNAGVTSWATRWIGIGIPQGTVFDPILFTHIWNTSGINSWSGYLKCFSVS